MIYNYNKLTDYQVAEAFGDALSLIYKEKVRELNSDLQEVYAHLDALMIPRISDFERMFARATLPSWAQERFTAIDHINKIRNMWSKMKREPESERPDYQKARSVPIETLYDFRRKGKNVSCPFHGEDRRPSMSLKWNKFHCFTCGAKGSTIDFMMRLNNWTLKEAVEYLNKL